MTEPNAVTGEGKAPRKWLRVDKDSNFQHLGGKPTGKVYKISGFEIPEVDPPENPRAKWQDIHFVLNKTQQERDEARAQAERLAEALRMWLDGSGTDPVAASRKALAEYEKAGK